MFRAAAIPETGYYRPELDGLRAIAILAVVLYHFFPFLVPAGYLGVDVFFVLSGFVITTVLVREFDTSGTVSILGFYARRMRRLMPALIVCVILTALLLVALTTRPDRSLFETGAFALIGVSNIYLWHIGQDYFSINSALNPFTQTWSLAVEDQFYLIFPFVFLLGMPRGDARLFKLLGILGLLSFLVYLLLAYLQPAFAFYMMPTRFWELALGAMAAITVQNRWLAWRVVPALAAALLLLLLVLFWVGRFLPVLDVALICGLTAFVLATLQGEQPLARVLATPALVWIGKRSYSLYLWHWSLLVLGKHTIGNSVFASLLLLALSLLCASLSYAIIENPLRHTRLLRLPSVAVALGLAVMIGGFHLVRERLPAGAMSYNHALPDFFGVPRPSPWWSDPCHGRDMVAKLADPFATCLGVTRTAEKPGALFLIGESHAAQLLPMAREATQGSRFAVRFINPENSADFPVAFFQPGWDSGKTPSRLLETVIEQAKAGDVVAIAFHRGQLNAARDQHVSLNKVFAPSKKSELFETAFLPYLDRLVARNVRILLIADTPLMAAVLTSPACAFQIRLFGSSGCQISRSQDLKTREQQDQLFTRLAARSPLVSIFDPLPIVYGSSATFDVLDQNGHYRMWDWNHITEHEARRLAPAFAEALKTP